jgi:hypothetical protein
MNESRRMRRDSRMRNQGRTAVKKEKNNNGLTNKVPVRRKRLNQSDADACGASKRRKNGRSIR